MNTDAVSELYVHQVGEGEPSQVEAIAHGHLCGDLIAVASSNLFGGLHWNGQIRIMNMLSGDSGPQLAPQCAKHMSIGVSDVMWMNSLGVAAACDDGSVAILTLNKVEVNGIQDDDMKELVHVANLADHDDICKAVDISRLTGTLMSGSFDGTVKQWNVSYPAAPLSTLSMGSPLSTVAGRRGMVWNVSCSNSDPFAVAIACQDGTIRAWDTRTDSKSVLCYSNNCGVRSVKWLPSQDHGIVAGLEDGSIVTVDLRQSGKASLLSSTNCFTCPVQALAFSGENKLVAGGDNGHIGVCVVDDCKIVSFKSSKVHNDYVRGLSVHPVQHDIVCSGSWDGTVKLINV